MVRERTGQRRLHLGRREPRRNWKPIYLVIPIYVFNSTKLMHNKKNIKDT